MQFIRKLCRLNVQILLFSNDGYTLEKACKIMNNQIYNILNDMSVYLSITQMKNRQSVLIERLEEVHEELENTSNIMYLIKFMAAKL